MAERERVGEGLPSASRRQFLLWGGGAALGLLLAPRAGEAAGLTTALKRKRSLDALAAHASGHGASRGAAGGHSSAHLRGGTHGARVDHADLGGRTASAQASAQSRSAPAVHTGAGRAGCLSLALYCVHTGEKVDVDYFVNGRYEPGSLHEINYVLRDHRNDETHPIDTRTLNIVHAIRAMTGSREALHVVSGYRSPQTNAMLRLESSGVAEHSFHMSGQAIDFYLPGRDLRTVRRIALAMRSGGVGYYPYDNFVHVDSGPVRRWG
jgi:uncharacterized protein YcbK (DUF882 family)